MAIKKEDLIVQAKTINDFTDICKLPIEYLEDVNRATFEEILNKRIKRIASLKKQIFDLQRRVNLISDADFNRSINHGNNT